MTVAEILLYHQSIKKPFSVDHNGIVNLQETLLTKGLVLKQYQKGDQWDSFTYYDALSNSGMTYAIGMTTNIILWKQSSLSVLDYNQYESWIKELDSNPLFKRDTFTPDIYGLTYNPVNTTIKGFIKLSIGYSGNGWDLSINVPYSFQLTISLLN